MKTVKITVENHRYNGEIVPPGTEISVMDTTASWLLGRGKAVLVTSSVKPPKPAIDTV